MTGNVTNTGYVGPFYEKTKSSLPGPSTSHLFIGGTRIAEVTHQSGTVLETHHDRSYGQEYYPLGGGPNGAATYRFNDRRDEGNGHLRFHVRNLDTDDMQWSGIDTVALVHPGILLMEGVNPFAYASYDPVNKMDSSGGYVDEGVHRPTVIINRSGNVFSASASTMEEVTPDGQPTIDPNTLPERGYDRDFDFRDDSDSPPTHTPTQPRPQEYDNDARGRDLSSDDNVAITGDGGAKFDSIAFRLDHRILSLVSTAHWVENAAEMARFLRNDHHRPIRTLYLAGGHGGTTNGFYIGNNYIDLVGLQYSSYSLDKIKHYFSERGNVVILSCGAGKDSELLVLVSKMIGVPVTANTGTVRHYSFFGEGLWVTAFPDGTVITQSH